MFVAGESHDVALQQGCKEISGIFCIRARRCYSDSMNVDLKSLQAAYLKVAALVIEDVAYLPIFERIDHEIATFEKQDDLIQKAKAVVARYKAVA